MPEENKVVAEEPADRKLSDTGSDASRYLGGKWGWSPEGGASQRCQKPHCHSTATVVPKDDLLAVCPTHPGEFRIFAVRLLSVDLVPRISCPGRIHFLLGRC